MAKEELMRLDGGQNLLVQVKQQGIEGGAMAAVQEQLVLQFKRKRL